MVLMNQGCIFQASFFTDPVDSIRTHKTPSSPTREPNVEKVDCKGPGGMTIRQYHKE